MTRKLLATIAANMTDDQVTELLALAIDVACYPSESRNQWARRAYVSWDYIVEMRELLDEVGVDWRAPIRERAEREKRRKAEVRRRIEEERRG